MPPFEPRVSSTFSTAVSMSTVAGPGVGTDVFSAASLAADAMASGAAALAAAVGAASGVRLRRQLARPRLRTMMAAVQETAGWALMLPRESKIQANAKGPRRGAVNPRRRGQRDRGGITGSTTWD